MGEQRYAGTLKKRNAERGYGFITADDGGQDIFVHISAFARNGVLPTPGEPLSFEVEPDRDGKRSAVRVRRPGEAVREAAPRRPERLSKSRHDHSPGFFGKLGAVLVVGALGFYGYTQYTKRAAS